MAYPGEIAGSLTTRTTAAGTEYEDFRAYVAAPADDYRLVRVLVPVTVDPAVETPILSYQHGVGGNENDLFTKSRLYAIRDSWLDSGYIVIAPDLGGAKWGNQAQMDAFVQIHQWAVRSGSTGLWTIRGGMLLYGDSMGGCVTANIVRDGRVPVWGAVLNSAVLDLANQYAVGTSESSISSAYGFLEADGYDAAAVGAHDPMVNPASAFHNVPMRFYASPGDKTVWKVDNTDPFVADVLGAAHTAEKEVVTTTGGHVSSASYIPADVNAFYARALAGAPTGGGGGGSPSRRRVLIGGQWVASRRFAAIGGQWVPSRGSVVDGE